MNERFQPTLDKGTTVTAPGMRCTEVTVGANVTCVAEAGGVWAAGLGDGRVLRLDAAGPDEVGRHEGAVTGLAVTAAGDIVSAGQDGMVARRGPSGDAVLRAADGIWITAFALAPKGDRIAAAAGKVVTVHEGTGIVARFDDHPSTVTGLAFAPDGSQIAASRYQGVSLWSLADLAAPDTLSWAGSMTTVSWSPDGRYVAAATQERELHVWDLVTERSFRLGGYANKVRALGWTEDGSHLYTTGADVVVAWPMAGDPGTMLPREIGYGFESRITAIAPAARNDRMLAGYSNGQIIIGETEKATARIARAPDGSEITGLVADPAQRRAVFGTRGGTVGFVDLAA